MEGRIGCWLYEACNASEEEMAGKKCYWECQRASMDVLMAVLILMWDVVLTVSRCGERPYYSLLDLLGGSDTPVN